MSKVRTAQRGRRFGRLATSALAGLGLVAGGIVLAAAEADAAPVNPPHDPNGYCGIDGSVSNQVPISPIDQQVAIYVGGDFTLVSASEAEGSMVVNGNMHFDGTYSDLGYVGGGSGLNAEVGSVGLRVGGNVTSSGPGKGINLVSTDGLTGAVDVLVGGHIGQDVLLNVVGDGTIASGVGPDAALGDEYAAWPNDDFKILKDLADANWNPTADGSVLGTAKFEGSYLTLTPGSSDANRHLFEVPAAHFAGDFDLKLDSSITNDDIVVIKVTGPEAASMQLRSVFAYGKPTQLDSSSMSEFGELAMRTLWIVEESQQVTVGGTGQIPGSILVLNPDSETTQAASGTNGRFWVAGDLIHNHAGSEFHNFPFLGGTNMGCELPEDNDGPQSGNDGDGPQSGNDGPQSGDDEDEEDENEDNGDGPQSGNDGPQSGDDGDGPQSGDDGDGPQSGNEPGLGGGGGGGDGGGDGDDPDGGKGSNKGTDENGAPSNELPKTGLSDMALFGALGSLLLAGGLALTILRKRGQQA